MTEMRKVDITKVFETRWRATENDLIGGWCIVLDDDPRTPAEGNAEVGDFLTQHMAEYICALHNWAVGAGEVAFILRDVDG